MSKVYIVSDKNQKRMKNLIDINILKFRKGPTLFMTPFKTTAIQLAKLYKYSANSEDVVIDEYEPLRDIFIITKSWTLKELEDEDSK